MLDIKNWGDQNTAVSLRSGFKGYVESMMARSPVVNSHQPTMSPHIATSSARGRETRPLLARRMCIRKAFLGTMGGRGIRAHAHPHVQSQTPLTNFPVGISSSRIPDVGTFGSRKA